MQRGDVYYADLNPVFGSEQGGMRPVVIIQNDIGNQFSGTVIVAPVTSKNKKNIPTHVWAGNHLNFGTIILLEQIRTIDKARLKDFRCHLSEEIMSKVDKALKLSLGLKYKEEDDKVNDLKVFNNEEMGLKVRTILNKDGSISVNAEDTAIGFGWTQTQNKNGRKYVSIRWETLNGFCSEFGFPNKLGKDDYIPESLFYRLGMKANNPAAEKFQNWLAMDVIPSIRKTGSYEMPNMTKEMRAILLLDTRTDQMEKRMDKIEFDMPLYGCEIDEVKSHVNRKGVKVLGGKQSEAYRDASIRGSVYSDMYRQLKREYGAVSSYKSIKRKYIADIHDFIDCYNPPTVLAEQIENANSQMRLGVD